MKTKINLSEFEIPTGWDRIKSVDMHTGGEPLRIPISGLPEIKGNTVLGKIKYFKSNYDYLRTGLMFEPRGHADMYGAIITPPSSEDANFDVFFLHNEGYSSMCGHAIIALVKFAFETQLCPDKEEANYVINVPAGKVYASGVVKNGMVVTSTFRNVPSFVYLQKGKIDLPDIGEIQFDIAYGGAFYAYVKSEDVGLELNESHYSKLIERGKQIKRAVIEKYDIIHPVEDDLSFLYGVIFTGDAYSDVNHSRNVCVFAEGEVDRSATGTGVSGRAALEFAKAKLKIKESITIESIIGSTMSVRPIKNFQYHDYNAIIPEVSGSAYFTGHSDHFYDPSDPWKRGFIFR